MVLKKEKAKWKRQKSKGNGEKIKEGSGQESRSNKVKQFDERGAFQALARGSRGENFRDAIFRQERERECVIQFLGAGMDDSLPLRM